MKGYHLVKKKKKLKKTPPKKQRTQALKSLSDKFLSNISRLELINCILSIKTKFLLIVKAMYFSNSFGITLIFNSNLQISCIVKWLHGLSNYEIIQESFSVNLRLTLWLQWAESLYFPVTWSWSLTLSYPATSNLLHIQHLLLNWNLLSSSADMTRSLLECFFINCLQYLFSPRIASINLLTEFFPL